MKASDVQRVLDEQIRNNFLAFLFAFYPALHGGERLNHTPYLEALAYEVERLEKGETRKLCVAMPPRHLKSIALSVMYPAWCLGRDPSQSFMCVSYAEDLANELGRKCRTVLEHPEYLRIFPNTRLSKRAENDLVTTANGGRIATTISGTATGRGAQTVICDDIINAADAQSELMRQKTDKIYRNTLATRKNNPAKNKFIVVQQRLHVDDLIGRLIKTRGWRSLVLPAEAEEDEKVQISDDRFWARKKGELLEPRRIDKETLEDLRAEMGNANYAAQYQQAPQPPGGLLFQRDWIRQCGIIDREDGDEVVQSWDTAAKIGDRNDYSACLTAILRESKIYIGIIYYERLTFPDLIKSVVNKACEESPDTILIEDASSGQQLLQHFQDAPMPNGMMPIASKQLGTKIDRAHRASALMAQGRVLICRGADNDGEFERQILNFPGGVHDDLVDSLSQLVIYAFGRFNSGAGLIALPRISPWFGGSSAHPTDDYDEDEIDPYNDEGAGNEWGS